MRNFDVMKPWHYHIIYLVLSAVMSACGHSDTYRIKGTLTDEASINLRIISYYDGAAHTALTAATDGKFQFEGTVGGPSVVEIYDNDYRILSRFIARNGDDIDLRIDRTNLYKGSANGNDFNKQLYAFYNEYADTLVSQDTAFRNKLVADYVASHPGDPVAQIIFAAEFDSSAEADAMTADSVYSLLAPESYIFDFATPVSRLNSRIGDEASRQPVAAFTYKTKNNRTATFTPQRHRFNVIAVSDGVRGRDSVVEALRKIAKYQNKNRLEILDLNVDSDTLVWSQTIRADSATWTQGWAAGAISGQALHRLALPGIPYFILTDSTGRQLWRGRSASEIASRTVEAVSAD